MRLPLTAVLLCIWTSCRAAEVPSSFRDWLYGQRVPVPTADFHPGGAVLGGLTSLRLSGGDCIHLMIYGLSTRPVADRSEVAVRISGVGIECQIHMSRPNLDLNFELVNSTIEFEVQVRKRELPDGSMAPLGAVQMMACDANLEFKRKNIQGFPPAEALRSWLTHVRNGLMSHLLCRVLTDTVDHWGRRAMANFAGTAALVIQEDSNPVMPQAKAPLVDWGMYPPSLFVQALLSGRLEKIMKTETVEKILRFGGKSSILSLGKAAGFQVGSVDTTGQVHAELPDVKIYGSGPHIGMKALMPSVRLTMAIDLLLQPLSSWLHFGSLPVQQAGQDLDIPAAPGERLQDKLNMVLDLNDISLEMLVRSMVSQQALDDLEVDQLQRPSCLGYTANAAATPGNRSLSFRKFDFSMNPVAFQAGAPGTLESEVFSALYTSFFALTRDSQPAMSSLVQSGLDLVIQDYLTRNPGCGVSTVYYGVPAFTTFCYWAALCLTLVGVSAAVGTCFCSAALRDQDPATVSSVSDDSIYKLRAISDDYDDGCSCLASHPSVPLSLAVGYPFLVTAALFLFLYADFTLGTTFEITFAAGEQSTTFGPIFTFSLLSIIRITWEAHAYIFAFLAAVMSGIWPLLKLVMLLAAWLTPEPILSVKWRGYITTFLDQYGKFSLVDIWLGIIGLASYHIYWEGNGASMKVKPVVLDGFFMFVIGTSVSLVLGHVAAICHQRSVPENAGDPRSESRESQTPSGSRMSGISSDDEEEVQIHCSDPGDGDDCTMVMLGIHVATALLIFLGVFLPSFKMIISGLAADLLTDPPERTTRFSLYSLGQLLAAQDRSSLLLQLTPYFMYFHTFVIPLVLCGALVLFELVRWLLPNRRRLRRGVLTVCRILDAWSALDVFALAVFVSWLEIGLLSRWLVLYDNISRACQWLDNEFELECIYGRAELCGGYVFLLPAGLLSYTVPKYVFYTAGTKRQPGKFLRMPSRSSTFEETTTRSEAEDTDGGWFEE